MRYLGKTKFLDFLNKSVITIRMRLALSLFFPVFLGLVFSSCSMTTKSAATATHSKRDVGEAWSWNPSSKRRTVRTTAYCHLENEPGANGRRNALGTNLRYGSVRSAAADWSRFPLGTRFKIAGQSYVYEIDDYGSALAGTSTIDLYKPTLAAMRSWGVRYVDIEIVKWGSFRESAAILSTRTKYPHVREMYRDIPRRFKS